MIKLVDTTQALIDWSLAKAEASLISSFSEIKSGKFLHSAKLDMALIMCSSQSRRGSKSVQDDQMVLVEDRQGNSRDHRDIDQNMHQHQPLHQHINGDEDDIEHHLLHDEADSGCECSLEELEGMDAWTKTMVAIRVLTAFKKRRKKKMEQEQKEKAKKERRKTLWRRLGFKLRIFNMFANKISSEDSATERLIKLKRKIGKNSRRRIKEPTISVNFFQVT